MHTVNFLEITAIIQPARYDVKIGPARVHGNRLFVAASCTGGREFEYQAGQILHSRANVSPLLQHL